MLVRQPEAATLLNAMVSRRFAGRPVTILEAGGGSQTQLDPALYRIAGITTVDISPEQLANNRYADVKIEADLQGDLELGQSYDLVIIYNVLEHLEHADRALETLARACAEDGVVVVGSPYMHSFSGLVTRLTPHWFHVLLYRHLLQRKTAGQPGQPPFRTFYHPLTEPEALRRFFAARGFACDFLALYEGEVYRQIRARRPLIGLPLMAVTGLLNLLTPKAYNCRYGDYHAVFRRLPAPPEPAEAAVRADAMVS